MENGKRLIYDEYYRMKSVNNLRLSSEEISISKRYLKNPTNAGLWRVDAQWIFDSKITNEIKEIVKNNASKLKNNQRRIDINNKDVNVFLSRTESISFYLKLFDRLVRIRDDSETLENNNHNDYDDLDKNIIDLLDLESMVVEYEDVLRYFEQNIYVPNANILVGKPFLTRVKGGSYICVVGPRDLVGSIYYRQQANSARFEHSTEYRKNDNKIELISLSYLSLKNVLSFFEMLKLVDSTQLYAVFSPDEEVLSPYVDILKEMMPYLALRESDNHFFSKMISDYKNDNYTGCISTAGLIAEDCLTQIYETIYRVPARKMMLGPLKQKISEAVKNRDIKELNHNDVIKLITEYKTLNKTDPVRVADLDSKILLKYIDEKYKKLDLRLDSIEGDIKDNEFFPLIIKINLEDLIRYRNAISHRSLDPIGSFEALKSIYCSFSIVLWWDEEKKKIDWTKDQKDIIKQFVQAAKSYTS